MKSDLENEFGSYGLAFSIGGQISIDCFPIGWDKRACLKHLTNFNSIYFFGDRTWEGGNDFEIYSDSRVKGNAVKGPENTQQLLQKFFL